MKKRKRRLEREDIIPNGTQKRVGGERRRVSSIQETVPVEPGYVFLTSLRVEKR